MLHGESLRKIDCQVVLSFLRQYGIRKGSLGLIRISKVGPARPRKLIETGMKTLAEFRAAENGQLSRILKLKKRIVQEMKNHVSNETKRTRCVSSDVPAVETATMEEWNSDIDPYRLRRALKLNVDVH